MRTPPGAAADPRRAPGPDHSPGERSPGPGRLLAGQRFESAEDDAGPEGSAPREVVVASHDSWNMSKKVLTAFTEQTGYKATVQPAGDAGALTNKLVLTKDSPIADVVYGIDNTFASRAVEEGVLAEHAPEPTRARCSSPRTRRPPPSSRQSTTATCASTSTTPGSPTTTCRRRRRSTTSPTRATSGLFVTPAPSTSSPGLAFLLADRRGVRRGRLGRLLAAARRQRRQGRPPAGRTPTRSTSPPAVGGRPADRAVLRQLAAVHDPRGRRRADHERRCSTPASVRSSTPGSSTAPPTRGRAGLRRLHDRTRFQEALPDHMYVFPVDPEAPLPELWADYAVPAEDPATLPEAEISASRSDWLETWADITQ